MTALVLVHGALGDARTLEPLAERLVALGAPAPRLVELAGHGRTPGDVPFAIEGFAAQLADAITTPSVVFGYSMGGYVALHLAATVPGLLAGVATLGTKLAWSPEVAMREGAMLDPSAMQTKVPKFASALAERHTALGWEAVCAATRPLLDRLGTRPLVTPEALAAIAVPVTLMVGDRDPTVSVEETLAAARALPDGGCLVLPRTGHPLERAPLDDVARAVLALVR